MDMWKYGMWKVEVCKCRNVECGKEIRVCGNVKCCLKKWNGGMWTGGKHFEGGNVEIWMAKETKY